MCGREPRCCDSLATCKQTVNRNRLPKNYIIIKVVLDGTIYVFYCNTSNTTGCSLQKKKNTAQDGIEIRCYYSVVQ